MMPKISARFLSWLLGFFLAVNVYLMPGNPLSPRATDLLSVILALVLLCRLLTGGVKVAPLAALLVLALPAAGWSIYAHFVGLDATLRLGLRWLMMVPWGYALCRAGGHPEHRPALAWGLWWGLAANVAVLVAQYVGLEDWTVGLGLAAADSSQVNFEFLAVRNPGLHGHPNASGAVASLVLPVGLYLYFRDRAGAWLPLLSCLLLLAAGHITCSRSPLVVAAVSSLVITACSRRFWRSAALGALVLATVVPLVAAFGPPGGLLRWRDAVQMEANSAERLLTQECAFALCVAHPLGVGVEAMRQQLLDCSGAETGHNAFLHVATALGAGLGLALLACLLRFCWLCLRGPGWPRWLEAVLAVHVFGLFFFEEHLNNPTFLALIAWLCAAAADPVESPVRPAPILGRSRSRRVAPGALLPILLLALPPLGACDEEAPIPAGYSGPCPESPQELMVYLVNREREKAGHPALAVESRLAEAAQILAADMARNATLDPPGVDLATRLLIVGYPDVWSGEIIGGSFDDAEDMFMVWYTGADPEPRSLILSPDFAHLGVGYAENLPSPIGYYWVLDIGTCSDAGQVPADGCHPLP